MAMVRCATCSGKFHQIQSDGPRTAKVVVYAERPGQWEESNARNGYKLYGGRRCLVGPTGREWNELYLPLAGLSRDEVFVGNVVQCGASGNRKPTAREIETCGANHIPRELEEVRPEVVVLMGATACSLIPNIDLEVEHGIPRRGRLYNWEGWVLPMYHPALGLHTTSAMGLLLDDWERVKGWIRGEVGKWPSVDSVGLAGSPRRDYALVETPKDLEKYLTATISFGNPPWRWCAIDTESHGGVPYSVQWSVEPTTARMILLGGGPIAEWVKWMNRAIREGMELVFHNAPADLGVIEALGVQGFRFRDTMQECYHLGLPQGLKALAYRLLGRRRKSWEETVTPASKVVMYDWLARAIGVTETWRDEVERVGKRGQLLKPKLVKSKIEWTLTSVLNHMLTSETYDPWDKLEERASGMEMEVLVDMLGEVPVKGVAHLGLEELVEYGCSDADDTLAVALELEKRRRGFEEKVGVEEEDLDHAVSC